jgi:putative flippase GtrA
MRKDTDSRGWVAPLSSGLATGIAMASYYVCFEDFQLVWAILATLTVSVGSAVLFEFVFKKLISLRDRSLD